MIMMSGLYKRAFELNDFTHLWTVHFLIACCSLFSAYCLITVIHNAIEITHDREVACYRGKHAIYLRTYQACIQLDPENLRSV